MNEQDARTRNQAVPLVTGTPVFSCDGSEMGLIKEVRDDFFKVDAPIRRDYWLRRDEVAEAAPGRVTVNFEHANLNHHRFSDPAPVAVGLSAGPLVLDATEQLKQRENMERELAEQRQRLSHSNEKDGTNG
ncbi:MAG: hypothetical protein ACSLFM_05900 [Tepidiformaceae bacterium]